MSQKNPVGLEHMFLKLSLTSGGHQNFCFDQAWGGGLTEVLVKLAKTKFAQVNGEKCDETYNT